MDHKIPQSVQPGEKHLRDILPDGQGDFMDAVLPGLPRDGLHARILGWHHLGEEHYVFVHRRVIAPDVPTVLVGDEDRFCLDGSTQAR